MEAFVAGGNGPGTRLTGRLAFQTTQSTATERRLSLPLYSTVTLLARLRGLSTSQPRSTAM